MSRRLGAAALGLLAIAALAACSAPATDSEPAQEKPETTEKEESPQPGIGTAVQDGDVEFTVNSVACSQDPMSDDTYAPLAPTGQFCRVNVSATALKDIGMFLGEITVTTAQSSEPLTPSVGAMMYAGTLNADYIDNGQTLTGDVVFDIPLDDAVKTVLLKQSALTKGVTVPVG